MAFNHRVRRIPGGVARYHCSVKGCLLNGTYLARFDYHRSFNGEDLQTVVTTLYRCDHHAALFIEKYGITMECEHG